MADDTDPPCRAGNVEPSRWIVGGKRHLKTVLPRPSVRLSGMPVGITPSVVHQSEIFEGRKENDAGDEKASTARVVLDGAREL